MVLCLSKQWLQNAAEGAGGQPELALRFDLTVPLARYVAEHEHDLAFPWVRACLRDPEAQPCLLVAPSLPAWREAKTLKTLP